MLKPRCAYGKRSTTKSPTTIRGVEQVSLAKVREVFTEYRCEGLHVLCETPWAETIGIKPGDLESDTGSWLVGDEEIPAATLEAALVVACEMVNRG